MTQEQKNHLQRIKAGFSHDVENKYRGGVEEHGGNLWENDLLWLVNEGLKEAVDAYTYLFTAKEKILERIAKSRSAQSAGD